MSYTFKPTPQSGAPKKNARRKSITLTDEQLKKFNTLKQNFNNIAFKQDCVPPTDAALWKDLFDYAIDDMIACTSAQLATGDALDKGTEIIPLPSKQREQDAKKIVSKKKNSKA